MRLMKIPVWFILIGLVKNVRAIDASEPPQSVGPSSSPSLSPSAKAMTPLQVTPYPTTTLTAAPTRAQTAATSPPISLGPSSSPSLSPSLKSVISTTAPLMITPSPTTLPIPAPITASPTVAQTVSTAPPLSLGPSSSPSLSPSLKSVISTTAPIQTSLAPTVVPTSLPVTATPTILQTVATAPPISLGPSSSPSLSPSQKLVISTTAPTLFPILPPTKLPTPRPTPQPSGSHPTRKPSPRPTRFPTVISTSVPTVYVLPPAILATDHPSMVTEPMVTSPPFPTAIIYPTSLPTSPTSIPQTMQPSSVVTDTVPGCLNFTDAPTEPIAIPPLPTLEPTPASTIQTTIMNVTTPIEPSWFELVFTLYTGSDLQRCKRRNNVAPMNGEPCGSVKTCFFGSQICEPHYSFPDTRCTCYEDVNPTWFCSPVTCNTDISPPIK